MSAPADPRSLALHALRRIEAGAYANLVLPGLLGRSRLDERDRAFATDLVYGVTRMRRACDFLVDRFLLQPVEPDVRNVLRLGAYQLVHLRTPPHAAVSTTVSLAPRKARGLVNAVLRRVAADPDPAWPDDATRLSYPDWIVERLSTDLGREVALAALEQMNEPPTVTVRPDGYVQDAASQQVAAAVEVPPGTVVADVCAAPGGKATLLGAAGASLVVAIDVHQARTRLVAANAVSTRQAAVAAAVADGREPPLRDGAFTRVLVDAPCSGLGVLRRRADARWRISPESVDALVALQRDLLDAAAALVAEDGWLVYSVCTLTTAETVGIDDWLVARLPAWEPLPPLGPPWEALGRGSLLLPQRTGTDGMYLLRLRRPAGRIAGA